MNVLWTLAAALSRYSKILGVTMPWPSRHARTPDFQWQFVATLLAVIKGGPTKPVRNVLSLDTFSNRLEVIWRW